MDLKAIVDQAKIWLDDEVGHELWKPDALARYADQAHRDACLRMRIPVDSMTEAVCVIELVEGQADYRLHPAVIVARRIEYVPADTNARGCTLTRTTWDALDIREPGWRYRRGRPSAVVQDLQARTLHLDHAPGPGDAGILRLTAWRRPLDVELLESPSDEPLVPEEHHMALAHGVCVLAYQHKDAETLDISAAERHQAQYEAAFGPRLTAAQIRELATDDAGDVLEHWF